MRGQLNKGHIITAFISILFSMLLFNCNSEDKNDGHESALYTCPMHPEIIRKKKGRCPICKMDLVPVHSPGQKTDSLSIDKLLYPTNKSVISNVEAIKPVSGTNQFNIIVQGVIAYDQRLSNSVSARVDGWLKKVYVKYEFQKISAGQRLFDLYSPELQNEQQNFIFLLKNETSDELIASGRTRLELLGLTANQINQIEREQKILNPLPYFSPFNGHLHQSTVSNTSSSMDRNAMPGNENAGTQSASAVLKEGMYVKKGQVICEIYSINKVWGLINIGAKDASAIREGDSVQIHSNGQVILSRIGFIEPTLRNGESFVTARVYLENKNDQFRIGENISATLRPAKTQGVYVPTSSVLSLGLRKIVFVKNGNRYQAREIQTGSRTGDKVEILAGLDSNSLIAKYAHFLIDSESFVEPNE